MSTVAALVSYDITEASIAATREACASMTADTPAGYEEVRIAIAGLRETRVAIEKRRVELKADALAYGRMVDAEAKRFTDLLVAIEEPLKTKKSSIDDAKARAKAEAEAARIRALEEEIAANRAKQEADQRAQREAEEARLIEERARLDAERLQLEQERQRVEAARIAEEQRAKVQREAEEAKARIEREAIEAERRALAEERQRAKREEFQRQAKAKAEEDARLKVERDRVEALELQQRLDALKPDLDKVRGFASAIRALSAPKVKSKKVSTVVAAAVLALAKAADELDAVASSPRRVA